MANRDDRLFSANPTVLPVPDGQYLRVAISGRKKRIASGGIDCVVRIWDEQNKVWALSKELKGHTGVIFVVAFADDEGLILLSGSTDNTIIEWDVDKGEQLFVFHGHNKSVWSLSILRGTNIFVSCSTDRTVRFWDRSRKAQAGVINAGIECYAVTFRPDNKHVAVGGDRYLAIFDITACTSSASLAFDGSRSRLLKKLPGQSSFVNCVSYSRDQSLLAAGSGEKSIIIYDSSTDEYSLLRTLTGHSDAVRSAVFVDNRLLFSGSSDKTIKLWDVTDGRCIRTIKTESNDVNGLAVSADGALFVGGNEDCNLAIFSRDEVDVEELFGDIKNAANDCD